MKRLRQMFLSSWLANVVWCYLLAVSSVVYATYANVLYVTGSENIRVAPLVSGGLPNLENGKDFTLSDCNSIGGKLTQIIPLGEGTGEFVVLWQNLEAGTACYAHYQLRFKPNTGEYSFSLLCSEVMNQPLWGGFSEPSALLPAAELPSADLNGDGKEDIVLIGFTGADNDKNFQYQVALGKENGCFDLGGQPAIFTDPVWTSSYTLADADEEGKVDFVYFAFPTGGSESSDIYMLPAQGNGLFLPKSQKKWLVGTGVNSGASEMVFGDFNEDGHIDLFLPPDDDINDLGQAHITFGNGEGYFSNIQDSIDFRPANEGSTHDTFYVTSQAYDVNLDGHIDIISDECECWIPANPEHTVNVYLGDGHGQFTQWKNLIPTTSGDSPILTWMKPLTESLLTVTKKGNGIGEVQSTDGQINCGPTCQASYQTDNIATITLMATAASGSRFTGWSGACSGTETCEVKLEQSSNVTATFNAPTKSLLTVNKNGNGMGEVKSADGKINCGHVCQVNYRINNATTVILTATTAPGSRFTGWSGACSGTGICEVKTEQPSSVTATFVSSLCPHYALYSLKDYTLTIPVIEVPAISIQGAPLGKSVFYEVILTQVNSTTYRFSLQKATKLLGIEPDENCSIARYSIQESTVYLPFVEEVKWPVIPINTGENSYPPAGYEVTLKWLPWVEADQFEVEKITKLPF
jgi:hypothetical protein